MRAWWLVLLVTACAGAPAPDGGVECAWTPLGDPEELARTPRALVNAELLALSITPGVAATDADYVRVRNDLDAIEQLAPQLVGVRHVPPHDPQRLLLRVTHETRDRMQHRRLPQFECLNAHYNVVDVHHYPAPQDSRYVELVTAGRLRMDRVAEDYRRLPGVLDVVPGAPPVPGAAARQCITAEGTTWHISVERWPDVCSDQCGMELYRFQTEADGGRALVEFHDGRPLPDGGHGLLEARYRCP